MTEDTEAELTAAGLLDEEVLAERLELMGAALEEPVRAGVFTDEELAALDDLTLTPVQPSPWYSSLKDAEKQIAMTAALRGLTARGVYRAEPVDTPSRTFRPSVDPAVLALLTLRRYVPHLVVVERRTAEHTDWALLYPQREETFLIEYVDHVGLHEFVAVDAGTAVDAMTEWTGSNVELLDPSDAAGDSGDSGRPGATTSWDVTLTREEIEARPETLEPLTRCLFSSTVTRFDPERSEEHDWRAAHAGREGTFVATPVGDSVRYRALERDSLAAWWREALL